MKLKTPLMLAQDELESAKEVLAFAIKTAGTSKMNLNVKSCRKKVDAFQKMVDDPQALKKWWASFSDAGRQMMLDSLDIEN